MLQLIAFSLLLTVSISPAFAQALVRSAAGSPSGSFSYKLGYSLGSIARYAVLNAKYVLLVASLVALVVIVLRSRTSKEQ